MQKYSLYIFIVVSAVLLILVAWNAGGIMAMLKSTPWQDIPNNESTQNTDDGSDNETGRVPAPGDPSLPAGKIKADMFTGKLEKVDTGCFADGECYVMVNGKHITALMGWSRDTVGKVEGVEGFGDLESHIGASVEVYAQEKPDGTYTLYGSEGFYIKLLNGVTGDEPRKATVGAGCMIGGCSSQLCVDTSGGDVVSTCEWRESYACYQTATCEKQSNGQCGWTETNELSACLADSDGVPALEMIP